jgi:2-dehydro-3-deoxy-D-arabinonate dehydratase
VRFAGADGRPRLGLVEGSRILELPGGDLVALLGNGPLLEPVGEVEVLDPDRLVLPGPWRLLLPLEPPEVWCAGVTYERSREARMEESRAEDVYALVYDAERPELFLKDAGCRRTVGPGASIGVRSDASWSVPEPELGVVLGTGGRLLGATIGNDVSSRDIEGQNPLYLPQAKVYAGACAIGPAVLVPDDWEEPFEIELRILAEGGETLFRGSTSTARMRRSFAELASFCVRDNPVPPGSVLLTGTGVVPPDGFTLEPGQTVEIHVSGIGMLANPVAQARELL